MSAGVFDLPWLVRRRSYRSAQRPEALLAAVGGSLEKPKLRWSTVFNTSGEAFEGEVRGGQFSAARIIGYRNSWKALIDARVEAEGAGSRVSVRYHVHVLVTLFMVVWISILAMVALGGIAVNVWTQHLEPFALIPLGMLAFAVTVSRLAFLFEQRRAEAWLQEKFALAPDQAG